MSDLNTFALGGNLTRKDPELQYSAKGTAWCNFAIANNQSVLKDGQWSKQASFFDCKAFGRAAEFIANNFSKGKAITITGKIVQEEWQDRETGKPRRATRLLVDTAHFAGSAPDARASTLPPGDSKPDAPAPKQGKQGWDGGGDEIPF